LCASWIKNKIKSNSNYKQEELIKAEKINDVLKEIIPSINIKKLGSSC
jgi:hypothetical protein